jgi:glycerol uptake facilitator-like aquaporin
MGGGGRDILVYWIGPVMGAVVAALLYQHVLLTPGANAEK